MNSLPSFDTAKLAEAVEALEPEQIDDLPFGVIGLDPDGRVRFYSRTEARLSGYKGRPSDGQLFFVDVAPCMNNGYFRDRIEKAMKSGKLDISFSFVGDFSDRERELNVRVQAAKDGGCWIFMQRPLAA